RSPRAWAPGTGTWRSRWAPSRTRTSRRPPPARWRAPCTPCRTGSCRTGAGWWTRVVSRTSSGPRRCRASRRGSGTRRWTTWPRRTACCSSATSPPGDGTRRAPAAHHVLTEHPSAPLTSRAERWFLRLDHTVRTRSTKAGAHSVGERVLVVLRYYYDYSSSASPIRDERDERTEPRRARQGTGLPGSRRADGGGRRRDRDDRARASRLLERGRHAAP